MKYTHIKDLKISKITLGTAQIGMKYGIANISGKPSLKVAYEILQLAIDSGINCFDTAPMYEDSERIIGSFLKKESKISEFPVLITKFPFLLNNSTIRYEKVANRVFLSIKNSMNRLEISRIPLYLLHSTSNLYSHNGLVLNSLLEAKDQGLIEYLGVSVYTPREILQSLEIGEIEVIQVPFNILDQRLLKDGLLKQLKSKKIIVLGRSIFLQGLIFLNPNRLPKKLQKAKDPLKKLHKISKREHISLEELAFNYVRDFPEISSVIIGAETTEQLLRNVRLLSTPSLSFNLKQEIFDTFNDISNEIIDPRRWNDM